MPHVFPLRSCAATSQSHPIGNVASVAACCHIRRRFTVYRVSQGDLENVFKTQRTASHRTHRLAARHGIGRERRHRFDGESGARCRGGACNSQQRIGRGSRRPRRRGYVDGSGEYVSVHSQADTEQADLALERTELKLDSPGEHRELTAIYVARGLDPALAKQVADQLMAHDAIGAHARDELGIFETLNARPIQAALASAGSFAVGAAG